MYVWPGPKVSSLVALRTGARYRFVMDVWRCILRWDVSSVGLLDVKKCGRLFRRYALGWMGCPALSAHLQECESLEVQ